ncbi:MAG: hypothetical protein ACJATE_001916 [Bacteroidia bacterium]|jgi:hypothetical protein
MVLALTRVTVENYELVFLHPTLFTNQPLPSGWRQEFQAFQSQSKPFKTALFLFLSATLNLNPFFYDKVSLLCHKVILFCDKPRQFNGKVKQFDDKLRQFYG